ncbi:hypothetical protein [Streptomyces sp. NPDC001108]
MPYDKARRMRKLRLKKFTLKKMTQGEKDQNPDKREFGDAVEEIGNLLGGDRESRDANLRHVVTAMQNAVGVPDNKKGKTDRVNSSGQVFVGPDDKHYSTHSAWHASAGSTSKNGNDSVSLFFVCDDDASEAHVIAVGEHNGPANYRLKWFGQSADDGQLFVKGRDVGTNGSSGK